ncbi:MAG: hypothetical protein JXQ80_12990 [Bacteroidales bacterium]|nr:hypothetical protein [Bacteroidales bacterium]
MSNASERLIKKLELKGVPVKKKEPVKLDKLKTKDIEALNVQMLKDFGYVE